MLLGAVERVERSGEAAFCPGGRSGLAERGRRDDEAAARCKLKRKEEAGKTCAHDEHVARGRCWRGNGLYVPPGHWIRISRHWLGGIRPAP